MTSFFDDALRQVASLPKGDNWMAEAAAIEAEVFRVVQLNIQDPDFPEAFVGRLTRIMAEVGLQGEAGRHRAAALGCPGSLSKLHNIFHEVGTSEALIRGRHAWSDKPDQNLLTIASLAQ